jgi:hypothetical protein
MRWPRVLANHRSSLPSNRTLDLSKYSRLYHRHLPHYSAKPTQSMEILCPCLVHAASFDALLVGRFTGSDRCTPQPASIDVRTKIRQNPVMPTNPDAGECSSEGRTSGCGEFRKIRSRSQHSDTSEFRRCGLLIVLGETTKENSRLSWSLHARRIDTLTF